MMLHRHFEKRDEKPAKKADMEVKKGQDIVKTMPAKAETEEPARRTRKRKE